MRLNKAINNKCTGNTMELLNELFESPVGIMSLLTIVCVIVIASFLFFWIKKQADKSGN